MKWQRQGNYIHNDEGVIVAILPDNPDEEAVTLILKAPKMLESMKEFLDQTDSGKLPAKRMYNTFKNIIEDLIEV